MFRRMWDFVNGLSLKYSTRPCHNSHTIEDNRNDQDKNLLFLFEVDDSWLLAPSNDLTYCPGSCAWVPTLALPYAGRTNEIRADDPPS